MATSKIELKLKLQSKCQSSINDLVALEKSVLKNSKSKDLINQSARMMVQHETALDNSLNNLSKMQMVLTHLHYQADSVCQSFAEVNSIQDQLNQLASLHQNS